MNKLWSVLLVFAMALGTQDVWAKRMGGGGSIGKQSSNVTQRQATPPAAAPAAAAEATSPLPSEVDPDAIEDATPSDFQTKNARSK